MHARTAIRRCCDTPMLVRDLGEFELIDRLAAAIADANERRIRTLSERGFETVRSIGDDAAAWRTPAAVTAFTTDTMVEGVHFDLRYTGWRDLGWKCLATNISDIAAMGCAPSYATVTLGLRGDIPVDGLTEMYAGMMDLTAVCGGAVVGGDVVKSPVFFVSVALEGVSQSADAGGLLLRSGAHVGDSVAVTGTLGASAAGLKLLMEGADPAGLASYGFLTGAHNRPMPRTSEGLAFADAGVRCAMDISDGLVDDLGKLCRASGVGARIYAGRIPADARLRATFPASWLALALGGGEDYELLIAAPADVMRRAMRAVDTPITVVGEIVPQEQGIAVLDDAGNPMPLASGGWDHFRSS